jgi:hypothetical protein
LWPGARVVDAYSLEHDLYSIGLNWNHFGIRITKKIGYCNAGKTQREY